MACAIRVVADNTASAGAMRSYPVAQRNRTTSFLSAKSSENPGSVKRYARMSCCGEVKAAGGSAETVAPGTATVGVPATSKSISTGGPTTAPSAYCIPVDGANVGSVVVASGGRNSVPAIVILSGRRSVQSHEKSRVSVAGHGFGPLPGTANVASASAGATCGSAGNATSALTQCVQRPNRSCPATEYEYAFAGFPGGPPSPSLDRIGTGSSLWGARAGTNGAQPPLLRLRSKMPGVVGAAPRRRP